MKKRKKLERCPACGRKYDPERIPPPRVPLEIRCACCCPPDIPETSPVYPDHHSYDHIRTWEQDGFRLELWDTHQLARGGPQSRLAYQLYDQGVLIFEGEDYGCSPLHATDSSESIAGLLTFLSLRRGDTDSDYFDCYSPSQLAWRDSGRAEELSVLACFLEESAREHS